MRGDPLVDWFRLDGDWSRQLGVPAHITLVGPLPLSLVLPREELVGIAAAARGTRYRLDSVGRLGDAICMFLGDEQPLRQWRERLIAAVGEVDAPDPLWRPHLTICRSRSPGSLEAVREAVDHALPVDCVIDDLRISRLIEPDRVSVETL